MTNVTEKLKFGLGRVENIVGKRKNAGFPTMFSKALCSRVVKSQVCLLKSYLRKEAFENILGKGECW